MPAPVTMRNQRERELVEATRALFDERGLQDAPMDEIARAVGINKALIYRVFASKEELFVLTVTHYLDELREAALDAPDLRGALDEFTRFCLRYPAFLDCALSLMRRSAEDLRERVSEGVWLRLGRSMAVVPRAAGRDPRGRGRRGSRLHRQPPLHAGARHDAPRPPRRRRARGRARGPGRLRPGPRARPAACVEDALALATARPS